MPDAGTAVLSPPVANKTGAVSSKLTVIRRLIQTLMLAVIGQWSFYGIFRCPFVIPYVSCQNCPVITCHGRLFTIFWGFWLLLPLSVILFGRAFCGWACPGGLISQMFGKIALFRPWSNGLRTRWARAGKFVALAAAVIAFFQLDQVRSNVPIRIGGFFESVVLTVQHAGNLWIARTLIVVGLLLAGLLLANAWCRFACPTGGLLEILKRLSIFRFYRTPACTDCDACLKVCEMGTRPAEADCTNCGDCLGSCPAGAIRFGSVRAE